MVYEGVFDSAEAAVHTTCIILLPSAVHLAGRCLENSCRQARPCCPACSCLCSGNSRPFDSSCLSSSITHLYQVCVEAFIQHEVKAEQGKEVCPLAGVPVCLLLPHQWRRPLESLQDTPIHKAGRQCYDSNLQHTLLFVQTLSTCLTNMYTQPACSSPSHAPTPKHPRQWQQQASDIAV